MDMIPLKTQARDAEKTAKILRKESLVPCVVYGNETENTSIQCDYSTLYKAYATAGGSTIVELDIEGKKVPVLFHELSFDPVSDKIIHVDFYAVNMKKEIETQVPLEFTGEAEAVESLGGVLITTLDHVTVTCLPTNLPSSLQVSIEGLQTFADAVHVSDIVAPEGVAIVDDVEAVVATVQEPRKEEEPVAEEGAEGEGSEGEAAGGEGEKKDGEEGGSEGGEEKSE